MQGLARRTGVGEIGADSLTLPGRIDVRACIDGADEAAYVAAQLRAWQLAGISPAETAVIAGRGTVAETLAGAARDAGVRVGEIGLTDISALRALALVGCDSRFIAADSDGFGMPSHEREAILPVLRACSAPREHLLITWRGRPSSLFNGLAEE
jgi:hypothetical protein